MAEEHFAGLLAAEEAPTPKKNPELIGKRWSCRVARSVLLCLCAISLCGLVITSWRRSRWNTSLATDSGVTTWEQLLEADLFINRAEAMPAPATGYAADSDPAMLGVMRTQCVIDVVQSTAYLGQAVLLLRNSAVSASGDRCPDATAPGCAATVTSVVASVAWVASYLSLAASSCAEGVNARAVCASDWWAMAADLGELAASGSRASEKCKSAGQMHPFKPPDVGMDEGAPSEANQTDIAKIMEARSKHLDRQVGIAQCSFDVVQASSYLVRVILQIREIALDCSDKKDCTIGILNILSEFAWLTTFMELAIVDCPENGDNDQLSCAAAIADLIAGTTSFVANAMSAQEDCADVPDLALIAKRGPGTR